MDPEPGKPLRPPRPVLVDTPGDRRRSSSPRRAATVMLSDAVRSFDLFGSVPSTSSDSLFGGDVGARESANSHRLWSNVERLLLLRFRFLEQAAVCDDELVRVRGAGSVAPGSDAVSRG